MWHVRAFPPTWQSVGSLPRSRTAFWGGRAGDPTRSPPLNSQAGKDGALNQCSPLPLLLRASVRAQCSAQRSGDSTAAPLPPWGSLEKPLSFCNTVWLVFQGQGGSVTPDEANHREGGFSTTVPVPRRCRGTLKAAGARRTMAAVCPRRSILRWARARRGSPDAGSSLLYRGHLATCPP